MVKWVSLKEGFAREDKHLLALVVKRDKRTLNFLPGEEKARERRDTELQKVWFFIIIITVEKERGLVEDDRIYFWLCVVELDERCIA
jgi:hypothetical protein